MQVTFALYPERHGAVWKTHLCHRAQPWPRLGPLATRPDHDTRQGRAPRRGSRRASPLASPRGRVRARLGPGARHDGPPQAGAAGRRARRGTSSSMLARRDAGTPRVALAGSRII